MNDYRWTIAGLPFAPIGLVMKGEYVVVRLDYEGQNERLLVSRLAATCRTLKQIDRKAGATP